MSHDLSIAVIHGMGSQQKNYSHPMRDEINDRLGPAKAAKVQWKEIYWANVLEPRQREYLHRANAGNDLDWFKLRTFMLGSFGDAAAYRKTDDTQNTAYKEIHGRVRQAIADLDDGSNTPLIIVAHSLGGHIMSNYIYDMQRPGSLAAVGLSDFQQMKTHAGMITFGCNIPFFALAYKKADIVPINFPGDALAPRQKASPILMTDQTRR